MADVKQEAVVKDKDKNTPENSSLTAQEIAALQSKKLSEEKVKTATLTIDEKEINNEDKGIEGSVDIGNRTFNITWGNTWEPFKKEDDDSSSSSNTSSSSTSSSTSTSDESFSIKDLKPAAVKEAINKKIKEYYNDTKSELSETWGKFSFAKEAMEEFFKTGSLPENKYSEEKEKEDEDFKLIDAEFPVFPGISFKVELKPEFEFGFKFDFGMEKKEKDTDVVVNIENKKEGDKSEPVVNIKYPKFDRNITLSAELVGNLAATLRLALALGIGYLVGLEGGLSAKGTVKGNQSDKDALAIATAKLPITKESKKPLNVGWDDLKLDLAGGVGITGELGADVTIGSDLFGFDKELYSHTFGEWELLNLSAKSTYVKKSSGLPIFSTASWTRQSSELELSAFGKQLASRKTDKYGLKVKENKVIDIVAESGGSTVERIKVLAKKLEEIKSRVNEGKAGNLASENSESFNKLMEEINSISESLNFLLAAGTMTVENLKGDILNYQKDADYLKGYNKAKKGIDKHEERINELEEWAGRRSSKKSRDRKAYFHYAGMYGIEGLSAGKEIRDLEDAKKTVATKENIMSYEQKRYEEVTNKHTYRLEKLQQIYDSIPEDMRKEKNPDFLKAYKDLGASELISNAYKYISIDFMKKYEQEQIDAANKKHTERKDRLLELKEKLNIDEDGMGKPNPQFLKFYKDELKGKNFFESGLMENHGNVDDVIAYEQKRVVEEGGERLIRIKQLKMYQERYDKADDKDKKAIEDEAVASYGEQKGEVGKSLSFAASRQDIIDYEIKRYQEYKKKKTDEYEKDKPGNYKKWAKKMDDDKVKDVLSLDIISDYERKQVEEYSKSHVFMFASTVAEHKKKHMDRLKMITAKNTEEKAYKDEEEKKKIVDEAKKLYFKDAEGIIDEFKKGDIKNPELVKRCFEDYIRGDDDTAKHLKRIESLCKFMGIPMPEGLLDGIDTINASASGKSDIDVNTYYSNDMGAGDGFADYYKKLKGEKPVLSIKELINYEEMKLRDDTKKGFFKRTGMAIKKTVTSLPSKAVDAAREKAGLAYDKDEEDKKKDVTNMDHFDRFNILMDMKTEGKSAEEIFDKYRNIGGGNGYEKDLRKRLDTEITPKELLDYEESHNGKNAVAHAVLKKMLDTLPEGTTANEAAVKYHELAQKVEGGIFKKKFRSGLALVGVDASTNITDAFVPEDFLTPDVIMNYELERKDELGAKHKSRLERLSKEDVTEENVYDIYQSELQAGNRFFSVYSTQVNEQEAINNYTMWDYDKIIDYENSRKDYYQGMLDSVNEPITKVEKIIAEMEEQNNQLAEYKKLMAEYSGGDGVKKAFQSKEKFDEFTSKSVGDNAVNLSKNVEETDKRGREEAEKAKEQALEAVEEFNKKMSEETA